MKSVDIDGVKLSSLVLGSCYFGTDIDHDKSFALMDAYYKLGGRTLDTARMYANWLPGGVSAAEYTVGAWLRSRGLREEFTVVTKGGHPDRAHMNIGRLSARELNYDMNLSLKCLGLSSVDVYILHRDAEGQDVGEVVDTLNSFIDAGKTKLIGASNWSVKRICEANDYAAKHGLKGFSVSQIQWSLALSTPEQQGDTTLVCMNAEEYAEYLRMGMPIMAFSSQAKGFFQKAAAGGLGALSKKSLERYGTPENLRRLEEVKKLSAEKGISVSSIVTHYITDNTLPAVAILGCSSVAQLEDSFSDMDSELKFDGFTPFCG